MTARSAGRPQRAPGLHSGAALALAALVATACTGAGIPRQALPAAPLVFVHRTEDEATRRVELLERSRGRKAKPEPGEGRARLEDINAYLGLGRTEEEKRADLIGRMAFLDARSEEVSVAEFALPGARPLAWSPDRRRLLYVSQRTGAPQVFEYDLEAAHLRQVTPGPYPHPAACYGPDGRIAWVVLEPRSPGSWVQRIQLAEPDGSLRVLTPGPRDAAPVWAPDGSVLLYELQDAVGAARIAAIDPDGGEPRLVARGRGPSFTPDASWVIYSARTARGWRLWRMRPDGTGKRSLGGGSDDEHAPSVSPDGRYVAYVSEEQSGRQRLRVRALDGSGDRPLLSHGDGVAPVWN